MPEIGRIYNSLTRDRIVEMIRTFRERLQQSGVVVVDDPAAFGESFIGLLRGDLFYLTLLGGVPPASPAEIERLARRAVSRLLRAFAPEVKPARRRPSAPAD